MTKIRIEAQNKGFLENTAKLRIENQSFELLDPYQIADLTRLLFKSLQTYTSDTTNMFYNGSTIITITTLVPINLSFESNIVADETVYISAKYYYPDEKNRDVYFTVTFPSFEQYDEKKYDFLFSYDVKNNSINPIAEETTPLSPKQFLNDVENIIKNELQKDLEKNIPPKIIDVLSRNTSDFNEDLKIKDIQEKELNYYIQEFYTNLKLKKATGKEIWLWETLLDVDFETLPEYIQKDLWRIMERDMRTNFPNLINSFFDKGYTIIRIIITKEEALSLALELTKSSDYSISTDYRNLLFYKRIPDEFKPEESRYYVHVVNEPVTDPARYVNEFMTITGEICASDLVDNFYRTYSNVFAIVLYGTATAQFPYDVYSHINPDTGLRELGQQRGNERTEAWIRPVDATLMGVITDIPGFQEKLVEAKIPIYDVDIESLQPEKTEGVWWDYSEKIKELKEREKTLSYGISNLEREIDKTTGEIENEGLYSQTLGFKMWYEKAMKDLISYKNELAEVQNELSVLEDNPEQYQQTEDISKQFGLEFYGKKRVCPNIRVCSYDQTLDEVKEFLEQRDDLRKPKYRGNPNPYAGHCYVATEALYYLLGGKEAGWHPMFIKHEEEPHWFLQNDDGTILDPTAEQFETPVPYDEAVGKGFLTNYPSARAQQVIDGMTGA